MTQLKYNDAHVWRLKEYYRTDIKRRLISEQYERIMVAEVTELDPYFTLNSLNKVLEIGPGMGVFSALLHKKYGASLYLIDGGTGDKPDYKETIGWRGKNPTPCADIEAMKTFLCENDIIDFEILELLETGEFRMIRNNKKEIDTVDLEDAWAGVKFNLIVSLRSWCWHYDADLYLQFVADRCIPHHTLLLIDIRKKNGQLEKLAEHFELIKKIEIRNSSRKMARLLMRAK